MPKAKEFKALVNDGARLGTKEYDDAPIVVDVN